MYNHERMYPWYMHIAEPSCLSAEEKKIEIYHSIIVLGMCLQLLYR